ncbi:MAG: ATP-binding protein [Elusimicrobiales bacterium]
MLQIKLPKNKSAFLWGPRKTGKTTFLKQKFKDALWIDLLDYNFYFELNQNPAYLRQIISAINKKTIVIDEVQKIPSILDEIHWLMENKNIQFILCGSSARKLRKITGGLLGGRAWRYELFPFVSKEIGIEELDLNKALTYGLIPSHYLSQNPEMDLKAYVNDYLKEEIKAEALVRKISNFSKFLYYTAFSNANIVNYSNISRECGVSVKTVIDYHSILEDTLIGRFLMPWNKKKKRRLIETFKFYFFDTGIVNALLNRKELIKGTTEYGHLFEHFIINECLAYSKYSGKDFPLYFYRTASGNEVDLILGEGEVAIEIKASESSNYKIKGLHIFSDEHKPKKKIIVSMEKFPRKNNDILILPYKDFLKMLWDEEII